MPFEVIESSIEGGKPIEFYSFTLGDTVWRYTTSEKDLIAGGFTWTSAAIARGSIKQTGESISDVQTLTVPSWIGPAQLFMTQAPSNSIMLTIWCKHEGDAPVGDAPDAVVIYSGEVTNCNFPLPGQAILSVESLVSSMNREGLRLAWQRSCPYAVYDPVTCKVSKAAFKTDFVVLTIDGFTLGVELATAKANGYFSNGFLEWIHPIRGIEYLSIEVHTAVASPPSGEPNAFFVVMNAPGELFEGAAGSVYPGCTFTPTDCTEKFDNFPNYGGVPDLPGRSPFDGNPVF